MAAKTHQIKMLVLILHRAHFFERSRAWDTGAYIAKETPC